MPRSLPREQLVGELVGACRRRSRRRSGSASPSSVVEVRLAAPAAAAVVVEEHDEVGEQPAAARPSRPTRRSAARTSSIQRGDVGRVGRRDEHDVGRAGGELERDRRVGERGDHRLALRRAGHDRRALDAEEAALEVDVVQLVAVDEAAGGDVLDDGVVLPAVPQPADDLDGVGRLVEQVAARAGRPPGRRVGRVELRNVRRPTWAASDGRPDTCGRQPARPLLT